MKLTICFFFYIEQVLLLPKTYLNSYFKIIKYDKNTFLNDDKNYLLKIKIRSEKHFET